MGTEHEFTFSCHIQWSYQLRNTEICQKFHGNIFQIIEILIFVDAWVKHQADEHFSGVPNPFVSNASWATQKLLFNKLILQRSNFEFL